MQAKESDDMVVHESQPAHTPSPLYMLAFDHRQVLRDLYPDVATEDLVAAKLTVLEALESLAGSVAKESLAFLVDEEYGGEAARRAREHGLYVAMPIEASRTPALELQYPDDFAERFARFDPQCVKALVFHNPADDAGRQDAQFSLLRRIGEFARQQRRDFLLEVLITPTPEQLALGGGDKQGFRSRVFPELMVESIATMQESGIEPDIWKIEGLPTVTAGTAVAAQANTGGRDHVRCIVLGSGESPEIVRGWLANASAVPSFSGLAIGRTVWNEPLAQMFAGRITREQAIARMALSFAALITAFGRDRVPVDADA